MKTLLNSILAFGVACLFTHSLLHYLKLPNVYVSHSTGECVKVLDYQGNKILNGCKNLPTKYHMVTVR